MCIERQNVFSFFSCLMFFKPQTGAVQKRWMKRPKHSSRWQNVTMVVERTQNPRSIGRKKSEKFCTRETFTGQFSRKKAEAFLTVAECHHGRREDTESSVHWKEKIWKILHTRDFHRTIFSKKGRSIPHGGRMSPWSSRGHRILGALDGKNLKNSAHERLSQDNFLENTALKVFLFATEHIDVELRWPSRENVDKSHKIWKNLTSTRRTCSLSLSRSARLGSARTRCLAFLRFSFCICSISLGIVYNLISLHFFFHCWKNMRMTLFWHATRSCSK